MLNHEEDPRVCAVATSHARLAICNILWTSGFLAAGISPACRRMPCLGLQPPNPRMIEKSSRSKRCRADFPGGSSQERGGGRGLPGTTVGFQGAMAFQATPLLPQDRGLATAGEDGAPSPGLGRHCAKCLGLSGTGVRVWHILEAWVSEPEQQSSRAAEHATPDTPECQGARPIPGRGAAPTWAGGPSRPERWGA